MNNDDTLTKFEIFVNNISADTELAELNAAMSKAQQSLGALISDKPSIAPQLAHIARIQMQAALLSAKPELAGYIAQLNENALELSYIDDMRYRYGDKLVDDALNDARTSYRTFYHSLQLRLMAERLQQDTSKLLAAFTELGNALSKSIADIATKGLADVLNEQPVNRNERRSAKYGMRRKAESDQQWARRNNRKRRH